MSIRVIKKAFIFLLIFLILATSGAFAKAWQTANESVCITGNVTNGANTAYTIAVYAPEKTYSNIDTDVAKGEENIKTLAYLGSELQIKMVIILSTLICRGKVEHTLYGYILLQRIILTKLKG